MMELTEVVLRMRDKIDVFPGHIMRVFYELRGYDIAWRDIKARFKNRSLLDDLYRNAPHVIVHPVCRAYPGWRKAKFSMSPADIEKAIRDQDPETYVVAKSWLPCFRETSGLRFPPKGKNDFLYRVYLSIRQKDTEGKEKKNVQLAATAYANKIINKPGMQNVIKGNVIAIAEGIDKAEKLPPKAQHQLEDFKKSLDESWKSNFFEHKKNNDAHPPKAGHLPVRCPKCNTYLTSGAGTPCRKPGCGWKP